MRDPAPPFRPLLALLLFLPSAILWRPVPPATAQSSDEATAELFEILDHIHVKGEDVAAILAEGADPNGKNEQGYTALAFAAASDHVAAVEALIAGGAKADARSAYELTPLMLAIRENNPRVVPILLEAGADIEAVDVDGWTPVIWAAWGDSLNAFRPLLEKGPRLDAVDKEGWSALTMAVRRASRTMIEHLREAGAEWTDPVGGVPILQLAVSTGDYLTLEEVLEDFRDLEVRGPNRETPLIAAAAQGHTEVVVDLLGHGADRTAKDADGKAALDHAREQGHDTVAALLGGGYTASTPQEATVVELPCDPLGGTLRVGLEIEGATLRAAVYYPRPIHSYLGGHELPGKVDPAVGLHFDTDRDRDTGLDEGSAEHAVAVGAEWAAVFTEVRDAVRYNNQHTPARRLVQVWMYKDGEEMSSWDMDDYAAETLMELDRASFELPFEVIGLAPGQPVHLGVSPAACESASKKIVLGAEGASGATTGSGR